MLQNKLHVFVALFTVHMSSTFVPSSTTVIIFRRIGSCERYRKRSIHLAMDEKKLVEVPVQGSSHKKKMQGAT